MAGDVASWKEQIARLDAALRPIVDRRATFGNLLSLIWHGASNPLQEAQVNAQAEQLTSEFIEYYATGDAEMRLAIRHLFDEHPSFSWAATLPYQPVTDDSFRAHLMLFSMKDQERDTRDAIVTLQTICGKARSAGVRIDPIIAEIAGLSSDIDKYGMGSTRTLLRRAIPHSVREA
jgi:hypothetical protein